MNNKQALRWSIFWILCSLIFAGYLFYYDSSQASVLFLSCYMIEKLLSLDNLFMFYVVFKAFNCEPKLQRKILNIGLISSYILRACLIIPGIWLANKYPFINYGFGLFLLYSSINLLHDTTDNDENSSLVSWIRKMFPNLNITIMTLITIELTDLIFALDSIPAGFAITNNSLLLLSANIFAILGLRSMYFLLLNAIKKFIYLEYSVAIILLGISVKILLKNYIVVPEYVLFLFIMGVMCLGLVLSYFKKGKLCCSY